MVGKKSTAVDDGKPALEAFVPGWTLRHLSRHPVSEITAGAVPIECVLILVDISGFTALTEHLASLGARGAEEVRELLNGCFSPLVELVTEHGGLVEKFAGDATLALWPVDEQGEMGIAVRRAVLCCREIQRQLDDLEIRGFRLRLRIGVSAGPAWATTTGGVDGRWETMIAGEVLNGLDRVMAQAEPGQVVLSPAATAAADDWLEKQPLADGSSRLIDVKGSLEPVAAIPTSLPEQVVKALTCFVPFSMQSRLEAGHTGWLAEFRRVTILFVNLGHSQINEGSFDQLQTTIQTLQRSIYRFGGSLNQLVTDDKGTCLIAAWGLAFRNYDDNAVRALRSAMDMRAELQQQGVESAIGVSTGVIYTGLRGNSRRMEYAMIGDAVNLAARLMQSAASGEILCDRYTRIGAEMIDFEPLEPIRVKGKSKAIQIFRPLGQKKMRIRRQAEIFGREEELTLFRGLLTQLQNGRGATLVVEGEAGIGKSHLVDDFAERARGIGARVLVANGDAIERARPHYPWREIFDQLLGFDELDADAARERLFEALEPEERELAPLLLPILPFDLPETEATEGLATKGRAERRQDLLVSLLTRAVDSRHTVLVMDDGQWLDSASWALLEAVHQQIDGLLLVIVTRPLLDRDLTLEGRRLLEDPGTVVQRLGPLDHEAVVDLIRLRLKTDRLPRALSEMLLSKAEGHPLFTEELAFSLRDQGLITVEDGVCRLSDQVGSFGSLSFPNTAQDVVTGRIDILDPHQQLTLKVASVLGRRFLPGILSDVHPIPGERGDLPAHLAALSELELVQPGGDDDYMFKHSITQEAAYELLPFAQRRELHRSVAEWHEGHRGEELDSVYGLLAHHWSQAEVTDKALIYLEKAGLQAERGYAYREVARFFSKALQMDREQGEDPELDRRIVTLPGGRKLTARGARRARWQRILGFAYANLGQLEDGARELGRSLELLGEPIPERRSHFIRSALRQVARQARHRLRPASIEQTSGEAADCLSEEAKIYSRIGAYYYVSNHILGFIYSMLAGVNAAEHTPASHELAASYADVCNVAGLIPIHSLARLYVRLAFEAAEKVGKPATTARVQSRTSIYLAAVADWSCLENLERSVVLAERLGDPYQWEESVYLLGLAEYYRGQFVDAKERARLVSERARRSGNLTHEVWAEGMAADAALHLGEFDEAHSHAQEARRLIGKSDSLNGDTLLRSHGVDAVAYAREGKMDEALRSAEAVLAEVQKGDRTAHVAKQGYVGACHVLLDLFEQSPDRSELLTKVRTLSKALTQFARLIPVALPDSWLVRARLASANGKSPISALRKSLEEAEKRGLFFATANAHQYLGRELGATTEEGRKHLERAREIYGNYQVGWEHDRCAGLLADL